MLYQHVLFLPYYFIRGYSNLKNAENFIFHAKIYHLKSSEFFYMDPEKFISKLYHDGWKVIFLHRTNVAKQTISSQIAAARDKYHRISDKEEVFYHELDIPKFESEVKERLKFLEEEKAIIQKIEHVEVNYERDLLNPEKHQETVDRIVEFLDLPTKQVKTHFRKTSSKSISEILTNYQDYVDVLVKNGWESYLD